VKRRTWLIVAAVVLTNTPLLLRAIPNPASIGGPCGFGTVQFYQGSTLVGVAKHDPFELTILPQVPGIYGFTAVATLTTGESETSDPAQVTVVAPGSAPDQHHDNPP